MVAYPMSGFLHPVIAGGGVLLLLAVLFAFPALLMWLWNITVPEVFGLSPLRYWQAFRLMLIIGILFGVAHFV